MNKCISFVAAALMVISVRSFPAMAASATDEKTDWQAVSDDYEKGKASFQSKDYPKAKRLFESVLAKNPDHAGANRYLGRICLEYTRDYRKAIRYLEKALSLSSGSYRRDPLYYLAQAYEEAGDYRQALAAWEEYLKYATPGSTWEKEARERIADLKARLQVK